MPDSKTVAAWVSCGCSDCRLRLENLTLQAENARLRAALDVIACRENWKDGKWLGSWCFPQDIAERALREGGPDA